MSTVTPISTTESKTNLQQVAADVIERQFERVAGVGADRGGRAAERADKADLDAVLCRGWRARERN